MIFDNETRSICRCKRFTIGLSRQDAYAARSGRVAWCVRIFKECGTEGHEQWQYTNRVRFKEAGSG